MQTYRVYISHLDEGTLKVLQAAVENIGHRVAGSGSSRKKLVSFCTTTPPDLVISSAEYPDGDGIDGLIEISVRQPLPAIVVAKKQNIHKVERAMDDHVMAYLIDPVTSDDLKPAIHVVMRRFTQFQELREENRDLREALETRKKMERAKGILMAKHRLTEEEAYLRLRKLATSKRIKLGEVAEMVIAAETGRD